MENDKADFSARPCGLGRNDKRMMAAFGLLAMTPSTFDYDIRGPLPTACILDKDIRGQGGRQASRRRSVGAFG